MPITRPRPATQKAEKAVQTKVIKWAVQAERQRAALAAVREAVENGGTIIFPTDTVYGLAANIFRPETISRIYRLKGRSYSKPLPFLVASVDQAEALVEPISGRLRRLLDRYWPGPLTVVFKTSLLGRMVTGGKETLAIRIPKHRVALSILKELDMPLATTSANPSGKTPAITALQALKIFRSRVNIVVDGGKCPAEVPSTVLDASSYPWTLVREGAVKKEQLLKYLS